MGQENDSSQAPKPGSARAARDARLKAALKANMQRRKAQARARKASGDKTTPPEDGTDTA